MTKFEVLLGILTAAFLTGIFSTAFSQTEQKYDCRMATYPLAVDVPQAVINQCRKTNK